jgi:hypothetical protein
MSDTIYFQVQGDSSQYRAIRSTTYKDTFVVNKKVDSTWHFLDTNDKWIEGLGYPQYLKHSELISRFPNASEGNSVPPLAPTIYQTPTHDEYGVLKGVPEDDIADGLSPMLREAKKVGKEAYGPPTVDKTGDFKEPNDQMKIPTPLESQISISEPKYTGVSPLSSIKANRYLMLIEDPVLSEGRITDGKVIEQFLSDRDIQSIKGQLKEELAKEMQVNLAAALMHAFKDVKK